MPGRILSFDEHPNFVDAWKELEAVLQTGKHIGSMLAYQTEYVDHRESACHWRIELLDPKP